MQLTLGRRWVLELQFSVSVRRRMEAVCVSVRQSVQRRGRERDAAMKWERDNIAGTMLSSWTGNPESW